MQGGITHPFLQDIVTLLMECAALTVRHVFREANIAADRVAAFVAKHFGSFLDVRVAPRPLMDIMFSRCVHIKLNAPFFTP